MKLKSINLPHKFWLSAKLWLIIITLFGAWLRFYNLNWDSGMSYHPDERNIAMAVNRIDLFSQLNPEFFAYGGLPVYIIKITGEILNHYRFQNSVAWTTGWGDINLIGRHYSALFSTVAIPLIYLVAIQLRLRKRTALLAALLMATSVGLIQYAHYGVTESWLVMFQLLILLTCLKYLKTRQIRWLISSGLWCGLIVGAKTAGLITLLIPFTSWLMVVVQNWYQDQPRKQKIQSFGWQIVGGIFFVQLTAMIFFLVSPYTVLDFAGFRKAMEYEYGVVRGTLPVPYTLQFVNSTKYWFQFKNLVWQTNPLMPLLWLISLLAGLYGFLKQKNWLLLPVLVFSAVYFGYVGSWYTKFVRYMLPLFPTMILLVVVMLEKIQQSKNWRWLSKALVLILIYSQLVWSVAYLQIYAQPNPRLTASRWIYSNIAHGSTILQEHWDDGVPSDLPDMNSSLYDRQELTLYDEDKPAKVEKISQRLADGDYIVISSRRLISSVGVAAEKHPIFHKYYDKLFAGELGYSLEKKFTSYPRIFGVEFVDDAAEESFQSYDHPVIYVFRNDERLSANEIRERLVY